MKLIEIFDKPISIKWVKYVVYISLTVAYGDFGMYKLEKPNEIN